MPPIITEIVDVDHRVAFGLENLAKRNPAFVNYLDVAIKPIIIGHAPVLAILLKLVKVAVRPAENRLESVVEAAQGNCARHLHPPPDGRFDAKERDLQFVDGGLGLLRWA
jgi:hypothetical protein